MIVNDSDPDNALYFDVVSKNIYSESPVMIEAVNKYNNEVLKLEEKSFDKSHIDDQDKAEEKSI